MEVWQKLGFTSYKLWYRADNKKRYAAKKAAEAEAAAAAAALTTVGVAAADEPMPQAWDVTAAPEAEAPGVVAEEAAAG